VKTGVISGDSALPPKIKVQREKSIARIFKLFRSPRINKEPIPQGCSAWRAGKSTLFLLGSYSPQRMFKNSSTETVRPEKGRWEERRGAGRYFVHVGWGWVVMGAVRAVVSSHIGGIHPHHLNYQESPGSVTPERKGDGNREGEQVDIFVHVCWR
jgi:hypothetical protein